MPKSLSKGAKTRNVVRFIQFILDGAPMWNPASSDFTEQESLWIYNDSAKANRLRTEIDGVEYTITIKRAKG